MVTSEFRRLGYDAVTGKVAFALTEPSGFLDAMTDGPQLSADEANFILKCVVEALGEVLPLAARAVDDDGSVARYMEAGRDIGTAVRDMNP
ncbi:hypothetical protein [Streptomyces sp. NRRL F-5053]|uniref:hypothetical protein n=1 Tax=Streptomyces sp. NRRL F-5053 TaxID=1463854 RepID=UPI0004C7F4FE|nr:hypothetical protein [Streptomyces sp. NRRL F-5053]